MFKMMFQLSSALNTSIANLTYFNRVETIPFALMELSIEIRDEFGMDEVKEGISHIAIVLYIGFEYIVVDG